MENFFKSAFLAALLAGPADAENIDNIADAQAALNYEAERNEDRLNLNQELCDLASQLNKPNPLCSDQARLEEELNRDYKILLITIVGMLDRDFAADNAELFMNAIVNCSDGEFSSPIANAFKTCEESVGDAYPPFSDHARRMGMTVQF